MPSSFFLSAADINPATDCVAESWLCAEGVNSVGLPVTPDQGTDVAAPAV